MKDKIATVQECPRSEEQLVLDVEIEKLSGVGGKPFHAIHNVICPVHSQRRCPMFPNCAAILFAKNEVRQSLEGRS